MKCPCYQCVDREVGCHSTCEKYIGWREAVNREKEAVRKSKVQDSIYKSAKIDCVIKARRRRNKLT